MLLEAAAGLWHLHANAVVHRDISARSSTCCTKLCALRYCSNFLVDEHDHVVICDFGLSRVVEGSTSDQSHPTRPQCTEVIATVQETAQTTSRPLPGSETDAPIDERPLHPSQSSTTFPVTLTSPCGDSYSVTFADVH